MSKNRVIIILGSPNSEAGEVLPMGEGRLHLGKKLFESLDSQILLTGGFGDHFNTTSQPHAYYARKLLISWGVPQTVFVEPALSVDTVDDALQAKPIVEKYDYTELHVVTSDFHVDRVRFIFITVFPQHVLECYGAPYVDSCSVTEAQALYAHEERELQSLRESGRSKLMDVRLL